MKALDQAIADIMARGPAMRVHRAKLNSRARRCLVLKRQALAFANAPCAYIRDFREAYQSTFLPFARMAINERSSLIRAYLSERSRRHDHA